MLDYIYDEIDNGKIALDSIKNRIEKISTEFNGVKDTADQLQAKEIKFLLGCANEEIDFAEKRIESTLKEIDKNNLDAALVEIAGMFERIEYADETADRANSILADVEIKKTPRKSLIDWDALRQDMQFAELRYFQKALKKSLMLRRFNLADNIFTLLKTLYKDYHSNIAA